jgi:peptidoglycan/LPS O-acetylase OafA/YrhL
MNPPGCGGRGGSSTIPPLDNDGGLWKILNRNSYGVYIIHVIVIGAFGVLLLHVPIPGWGKYVALIALACSGSNLLVWAYRRSVQVLRPEEA